MLTVAISKRNKLQNIIVLTPKDGYVSTFLIDILTFYIKYGYITGLSELS